MWIDSESHSRVDAVSHLNQFVYACVCACVSVFTYVSVHCALCLETNPAKASLVECTNMRAECSHTLLLSSCCQLLSSHASPPHFLLFFHYSCINPFMNPTITAALYFHASCDEALAWLTQISAAHC